MRLAFQQTPSEPDVLMQIAESGAREHSCTRPHHGLLSWRDPVRIGDRMIMISLVRLTL
jgi:hypothetical protein